MQFDKVYLHKCYENELGFRNGLAGKAGRFFLIGKDCISFFPHLSKLQLNDNLLLNIVSPDNQKIVMCNYVFHNSKYADIEKKKNRNEYRLYVNNEIDIDRSLFQPEDIIAFTKYRVGNDFYYKLNYYPVAEGGENYEALNNIMLHQSGNRTNNHLLVELDNIPFLQYELNIGDAEKILTMETVDKALKYQATLFDNADDLEEDDLIDYVSEEDMVEVELAEDVRIDVPNDETGLIKSNNFRELVLFAYENKCAITGQSINYDKLSNLEAAHIKPQAHFGPDALPNGVALSRDMHWAFDKGFFTIKQIDDVYLVEVHENVRDNEIMNSIHERPIYIPYDPRFRINNLSLIHHQEHVFGTFRQIRSRSS